MPQAASAHVAAESGAAQHPLIDEVLGLLGKKGERGELYFTASLDAVERRMHVLQDPAELLQVAHALILLAYYLNEKRKSAAAADAVVALTVKLVPDINRFARQRSGGRIDLSEAEKFLREQIAAKASAKPAGLKEASTSIGVSLRKRKF
jgi:hypothetical protein